MAIMRRIHYLLTDFTASEQGKIQSSLTDAKGIGAPVTTGVKKAGVTVYVDPLGDIYTLVPVAEAIASKSKIFLWIAGGIAALLFLPKLLKKF